MCIGSSLKLLGGLCETGMNTFFAHRVCCLIEQTLSIFLILPGHRAVDDASVLFRPSPPHHFRQDQAFPSCVHSQRSSLAAGQAELGLAPSPPYRAGLEADFAASTFHHGLPLWTPCISLSAIFQKSVKAHGHGTTSGQGACEIRC